MKTPRQVAGDAFTRIGIVFMQLLAALPLPVIRAMGVLLGWVLYVLAGPRRRVVATNLRLCFPDRPVSERRRLARQTFMFFAQAWLDRSWLWHGHPDKLRQRLHLKGALAELDGEQPVVLFAPHFVGLDAGWAALTQQLPRAFTTIYTDQANKLLDRWILRGRRRFGNARLFSRAEGVQPIVKALRAGQPLYLLPDMNFGPEESVFVPFYGVDAATVPSLSRFAKLGRAKVVPVVTRLTSTGYEVELVPAWTDVPSADFVADTALMNARLQEYINTMPAQYYWVHKRFKSRPDGEPSIY
ncbi:MAG: lipid A biosynthesis acyltransferase [Polaromonas sp.]|nr:lipid A biosynthesis acyltransferase [Polaromonas sp.]